MEFLRRERERERERVKRYCGGENRQRFSELGLLRREREGE